MAGLKPVFGGACIGTAYGGFTDEAAIKELYEALLQHGVTTIDSARLYGGSEEWLGRTEAGTRFTIDTKSPGGILLGARRVPESCSTQRRAYSGCVLTR